MKNTLMRLGVVENLGAIDRIVRFGLGGALLGMTMQVAMTASGGLGWYVLAPLVAIYPMLTAILGFDPLYAMMGARTCSLNGRNQCGTFPFEMASLFGKRVECSSDYDCSLETAKKH